MQILLQEPSEEPRLYATTLPLPAYTNNGTSRRNRAYTYLWQSSPDNSAPGRISGGATASTYTPPALTASTYYRRRVTSGSCAQVYSPSVLITVYGQLTAGTIGTAQSICYNTAPAALTQLTAPSGVPGAYTYQWQDSPDNVTFNNIGGATGVGYAPPYLQQPGTTDAT